MSVLIINFGSQFTQLIAKRLREISIEVEIVYYRDLDINKIINFKAIIISGSDRSVNNLLEHDLNVIKTVISLSESSFIPVLGICFGFHLLCDILCDITCQGSSSEFGNDEIIICGNSRLVEGISPKTSVWMSHCDSIAAEELEGFDIIARSSNGNIAVVANDARMLYGVQFHPEVSHTTEGSKIIENFTEIANCEHKWNLDNYRDLIFAQIKQQVGTQKVLAAVSGGVDSTVAALMMHKIIGDDLYCVLIDHGLLRKNEVEYVVSVYSYMGIKLHVYDESEKFFNALCGITDPEKKRKIIGGLFIECFENSAKSLCDARFLMQGTLYPDVIESGRDGTCTIKSHHNVGGLPEVMNLQLIEPLKHLFKYEVRQLGFNLGLKEDFILRHPFPGPGLAVRIPGEVSREKVKILQDVDHIYITLMKERGLYNAIWQAFVVLLPLKAVGVMGDSRTYEYSCVLRAVTSEDAMTADVFPFSDKQKQIAFWDFLREVSIKIVNSVKGVNRVLYDITSKPPGTIEWE